MTRHPHRFARGLASIVVLLCLFIAVPIALVAAARSRFDAGNPLSGVDPPWRWEADRLRDTVSEPLRDDAVINLLMRSSLAVIWIALAVIAITVVTEVAHMARHQGLPAPHVRGLGWAQRVGHWVAVGIIALLPVNSFSSAATALEPGGGPAATAQRWGGAAESGETGPRNDSADPTASRFGPDGGASTSGRSDPTRSPTMPTVGVAADETVSIRGAVHVVQRGESIYAIAADYAADDAALTIRIAEGILDLNLGGVMADGQRFTNPALIHPGWTLTLPDGFGTPTPIPPSDDDPTPVRGIPRLDASVGASEGHDGHITYVVIEGDTLSGIADDHLGAQRDWPQIWEANRGDEMGRGRTFDDPNLILPGWELDVPSEGHDATTTDPATSTPDETTPEGGDTDTTIDDLGNGGPPTDTVDVGPDPVIAPGPTTPPVSQTPSAQPNGSVPSTTAPVPPGAADERGGTGSDAAAPRAPAPTRLEHAALLAAGILTLVGVRRRRALRSALPHARVPAPPPEITAIERRLRTIDPGERAARIDVAVRAVSHHLTDTGVRIGSLRVARDGAVTLRLTSDSPLAPPWAGSGASWTLPASVPIELLSDDARKVGQPCLALVTVGVDREGRDVLVVLEAAGLTTIEAQAEQADDIVRAIGSGLATSLNSEVVHLVVASLGSDCLFDHPNARVLDSVENAVLAATALVGSTMAQERSTFDLRALRTGGEMWEPAIVLLGSGDDASLDRARLGHGLAVVAACAPEPAEAGWSSAGARLVAHADRWVLHAFGENLALAPIGVSADDIDDIAAILTDAERPIDSEPPIRVDVAEPIADPLVPRPHDIVVGLMGAVTITSTEGTPGEFERSKTVELIAWLATHRDRATRQAARTALWEMDVRDATFANVVSEARRALGRLVEPPEGEEWIARTLNESLPLHQRVVTDVDLIEQRVAHARLAPPAHAIDVLKPAVAMIRDLPFAGTSYLWPDADGITSSLVLLATTAAADLAAHALSIGDTDLVFWSTGHGLRVLPGHEELVGLRMRAHARAGDLAGVRQEWESYERVITADSWSDGEPAPKLLELRRDLLTSP